MAVSGSDSVWRRLSTALDKASTPANGGSGYPGLAGAHPVFYAAEQVGAQWFVLGASCLTPQEARDELAHQFLLRAASALTGSREQDDYRAAAGQLDRERHDQMITAGRHFQVVRADQVLRMGSDGPEPPRQGDESLPGIDPDAPQPERRFIGEADSDTSAETAALRAWAVGYVIAGSRPADVVADAEHARAAYPQVVLLGTWYAIGEEADGAWHQPWPHEHPTPAEARDSLIFYFREYAPAWEKPSPQTCAAYAEAANTLERGHGHEVTAAGRRFRITRIHRMIRMNAGNPEPPRSSDFDPYPPPAA